MTFDKAMLALVAVTPDDPELRQRGLAEIASRLIDGGVTAIMFREKSLDETRFTSEAIQLRRVCARKGAAFILNERVELASALEPDIVHLTHKSSCSVEEARRRLGNCPLGVSVHDDAELEAAEVGGAHYVVFGPVFDTPSKHGILDARGLEELGRTCRATELPVVAIGGLNAARAAAARDVGASGVAAIRALFHAAAPLDAARDFRRRPRS